LPSILPAQRPAPGAVFASFRPVTRAFLWEKVAGDIIPPVHIDRECRYGVGDSCDEDEGGVNLLPVLSPWPVSLTTSNAGPLLRR